MSTTAAEQTEIQAVTVILEIAGVRVAPLWEMTPAQRLALAKKHLSQARERAALLEQAAAILELE